MIDLPDCASDRAAAEKLTGATQGRLNGCAGDSMWRVGVREFYGDRLIVDLIVKQPRPLSVASEIDERRSSVSTSKC